MLVIRLQRTGRKGHAQFRIVVQDSRRTPSSGKVVAQLGTYNPHSKEVTLNIERAQSYLANGAQPSDRIAKLFTTQGVSLPEWVTKRTARTGAVRNPDKLRRNRPAEEVVETPAETPAEEPATEVAE